MPHAAIAAVASAYTTEDEKCGGAGVPAFAPVGTTGLLAYGVKQTVVERGAYDGGACCCGNLRPYPVGMSAMRFMR